MATLPRQLSMTELAPSSGRLYSMQATLAPSTHHYVCTRLQLPCDGGAICESGGVLQVALPVDPRHWSREHVQRWLQQVAVRHQLPPIQTARFLMNGKALCLMSPSMFMQRVPLGGKLLYKDFQLRLSAAMHHTAAAP